MNRVHHRGTKFMLRDLPPGIHTFDALGVGAVCLGRGNQGVLGDHVKILKFRYDPCPPGEGERVVATCIGPVFRMVYVCRQCACNAHSALCHRHGLRQVGLPAVDWRDFRERVLFNLVAGFATYHAGLLDTWILRWNESKRSQILESQSREPVRPDLCKVMVKIEVYPSFPRRARLIQFYWNLVTQALFAPIFCALQGACKTFDDFELYPGIFLTFASGMNNIAIGHWMTRVVSAGATHFYERDGKSWDSTMQRVHHELRRAIYGLYNEQMQEFVDLCAHTKNTYCKQGGFLQWTIDFTVKSGHNDTSLGNSLVNAAIAIMAMLACGIRGHVIVAGDDLLVAVIGDFDADRFAAYERAYGIIPEYRKFADPYQVSFISGCWYPGKFGFLFAPLLGRLLAKLYWTVANVPLRKRAEFVSSVAAGLFPACGGLPIVSALLATQMTHHGKIVVKYGYCLEEQMYHASIWDFCARKYCCSVGDLEQLQQFICDLGVGPCYVSHPLADHIMGHDHRDLGDRGWFCE